MIMTPDKLKLLAEISNKAKENCLPVIIFETDKDMKACLEDMKLGAVMRAGLRQYGYLLKGYCCNDG